MSLVLTHACALLASIPPASHDLHAVRHLSCVDHVIYYDRSTAEFDGATLDTIATGKRL